MPHIQVGNPDIPAESTHFNWAGVADRVTATTLYDALYESTVPPDPLNPMSRRQAAFGPGALNYSPFINNYTEVVLDAANRIKIAWPANVGAPYTGTNGINQPRTVAELTEWKKQWNKGVNGIIGVEDSSIAVHQRAFAFTSGDSIKHWLSTQSMSPCVTIILWKRKQQTGALAHVDKDQDLRLTIDSLFNEIRGEADDPVRVHFHGGNCSMKMGPNYISYNTATGLLEALLARGDTQNICISTFDVLARAHGNAVAFNTRDGRILPDIGENTRPQLDSLFRLMSVKPTFAQQWPEGFYALTTSDILTRIAEFNRGVGREGPQASPDRDDLPINPAEIFKPRLQTDLRTIDTSNHPQERPPVYRFFEKTKTDLLNWAVNRIYTIAGGGEIARADATRARFPADQVRGILAMAGGMSFSVAVISTPEQAKSWYEKLAAFEKIVRKPKPEGDDAYVGYLETLAAAMNMPKQDIDGVAKASVKWTTKYGST